MDRRDALASDNAESKKLANFGLTTIWMSFLVGAVFGTSLATALRLPEFRAPFCGPPRRESSR
jgi:uncharacterized membrane protein YoaK (UPF0700 family)